MKLPIEELLTALYSRLTSGDNKIGYQVYDDIPENVKPPYVEIGETSVLPWNEKGSAGTDVDVTLHFWSIKQSNKELDDMKNAVLESITVTDGDSSPSVLTLTNHTVINQFLVNAYTLKDVDMRTRHGVLIFNFQISQN